MHNIDTIIALSTPVGRGAIAKKVQRKNKLEKITKTKKK